VRSMSDALPPLLSEPLSVELANTVFSSRGQLVDSLEDPRVFEQWLDALSPRLPVEAPRPWGADALPRTRQLRDAIRSAFTAAAAGSPPDPGALATLNDMTRAAPGWAEVSLDAGHVLVPMSNADPHQRLLAAFAVDAMVLLAGPQPAPVRACESPGCVLFFVQDHPRRRCCSTRCANRARAARHYAGRRSGQR